MSRILHKSFKYVTAAKTDIRKTFARIRREKQEAAEATKAKVQQLPRKVSHG